MTFLIGALALLLGNKVYKQVQVNIIYWKFVSLSQTPSSPKLCAISFVKGCHAPLPSLGARTHTKVPVRYFQIQSLAAHFVSSHPLGAFNRDGISHYCHAPELIRVDQPVLPELLGSFSQGTLL